MAEHKSVCDQHVFETLYNKHSELIRNFMYYKCGDVEQAEDITQDAFVKLWKNCKKVVFSKAKSFVMKVAQNMYYNQLEHKKVVLKHHEKLYNSPLESYSPEFLMEEKEFRQVLEKSIGDLKPKQREVFLLSRLDKKTYREIADIVGITQKAVERRMHLALMELHEKIGISI